MTSTKSKIAIDHSILLAVHNSNSRFHQEANEFLSELAKDQMVFMSIFSFLQFLQIVEQKSAPDNGKTFVAPLLDLYSKHPRVVLLTSDLPNWENLQTLLKNHENEKLLFLMILDHLITHKIDLLYTLHSFEKNFDNIKIINPFSLTGQSK